MLRTLRIILALIFFAAITAMFLDFTGCIHGWFAWMAKIQFLPALLAVNVGVVLLLVLLTLTFGRIYCSVICPLGVMQDIFAWLGKRVRRNRYTYSPAKSWLRYGMLVLFMLSLVMGIGLSARLLAPYSAYGRIAGNLLAPIWYFINNGLAYLAERVDSYAFYETDVWIKSVVTMTVSCVTLLLLAVLAWRGGRTYCNTICPVGTVLGFFARFAWFKPVMDASKCVDCGLCARNCKASCIDVSRHAVDYSRCVACMDCIGKCKKGAIKYVGMAPWHRPALVTEVPPATTSKKHSEVSVARRAFLSSSAAFAATGIVKAQKMKVDGGLAIIEDKEAPVRKTPILPAGSVSAQHFAQHCTACQLCVSVCPNGVLRPSSDLSRLMQPEMSYERGYCRPECTRCSEVCPAGPIRPVTSEEKSSIQIGHAVWRRRNCIPVRDGQPCGNCARHCPTGAIQMVPMKRDKTGKLTIPVVDTERCIGCGACENLCPARPFSAIHVEGHEVHRMI